MKNYDKICMERMAEAISENRTKTFFKELYKIKGRNNFAPCNIDGFCNEHDIEHVLVLNIRIFIVVYHTTERE